LLTSLLPLPFLQSQAYARAHGIPQSWNKWERGFISNYSDYHITDSIEVAWEVKGALRWAISSTYVVLNLLVVLILAINGARLYRRLTYIIVSSSHQQSLASAYWGTSIILGGLTCLCLTGNILFFVHPLSQKVMHNVLTYKYKQLSPDLRHDLIVAMALKCAVMIGTLVVDTVIVILLPKNPRFPIPPVLRKATRLFCCQISHYRTSQLLQTCALWCIVMATQYLIGQGLLPHAILFIMTPSNTLFFLGLLYLTLVVLSVGVVYCIHHT